MFVIYHVFDKKIGCTRKYPSRCYEQGFEDGEFEVIEKWPLAVGESFAGDRERYWQDMFGYKRDTLQYDRFTNFLTKDHQSVAGRKGGSVRQTKMSPEERAIYQAKGRETSIRLGKLGFQQQTLEEKSEAGKIGGKISGALIHTCQYCGKTGNGAGMFVHIKHCKHRKGEG
jgi:hypothetical protein